MWSLFVHVFKNAIETETLSPPIVLYSGIGKRVSWAHCLLGSLPTPFYPEMSPKPMLFNHISSCSFLFAALILNMQWFYFERIRFYFLSFFPRTLVIMQLPNSLGILPRCIANLSGSPQIKSISVSGHLALEGLSLTTFSNSFPSLASVWRLVHGALQHAVLHPPSSVHWTVWAGEQAKDLLPPFLETLQSLPHLLLLGGWARVGMELTEYYCSCQSPTWQWMKLSCLATSPKSQTIVGRRSEKMVLLFKRNLATWSRLGSPVKPLGWWKCLMPMLTR